MKILFTTSAFRLSLGLLTVVVLGLPAVRAQDPFTRILSGPVVSGINSTILAWGDFNNDGFQDLFVSTRTGPSLLYSNKGDGTFAQVSAGPVATDSGSCFGATWGDYDNDGFLDLFVGVNNNGSDWLYHNNSHGGFTKITTGAIVNSGGNANNTSWADYDNDGFLDLFVANSDQNDFLYHNNGDGTFTRITTNAIALKPGNSQGGSWADYDNDGLPDLFVSRVNEPNLLYHNEGNGVFTPVTNGIIVHDVSVGQGTSWGDYDNDGYLDLFVANPNAPNFLYHNNGDGTFNKITNDAVVAAIGNGIGCGWADYDNDGYLDLFVANRTGANALYHNNGDGTFTRVTNSIVFTDVADAISGAWADYDNDGFPDLFVTELNSFNNRLYRNNGNSNGWLTLKLEGRLSNRSAIGAKVRVKAMIGGQMVSQLREISGGGGLGSQNDLRAGFGLRDATNVDLIRIEWPSGLVQELQNVAIRQFMTVIEPSASISPGHIAAQAGDVATFTLSTDLAPPLLFEWRRDGVPLSGATNAVLTIASVSAADAGRYSVRLTQPNTGFSMETRAVELSGPVVLAPSAAPATVKQGSNLVVNLVVIGTPPITYQWLKENLPIAGATNATLVVTNFQLPDEAAYSVAVSNSFGRVSQSQGTIIVLIRPVLTMQPLSQNVAAGGNATFSVSASGHPFPFTFRWLSNGIPVAYIIDSDTNSFLTVTNAQATAATNRFTYRVVVTNLAGTSAASINAFLTVLPDTDGDGLPDEWESAHSLNPLNPDDAQLDADGDGLTNAQEYEAGTNPNDATSFLRLNRISYDSTNFWRVSFIAMSNRTYSVEARESLRADSVTRRAVSMVAAPTNRLIEVVCPAGEFTRQQFFRLITPHQP